MTEPLLSCPKQGRCPGCALGAEAYEAGLARKGRGLRAALEAYPALEPELLEPRPASPTQRYRLRAKLVCHGTALGLFERDSHRVIDVSGCKVLSPALTVASEALRRLLPLPVHAADLRETSEGVLLTLLTEEPSAREALTAAAETLVAQGAVVSVALGARRPGEVRLLSGAPELLLGPSASRHRLSDDAPYAYAAHGGFVQAHGGQARYVDAEITRGLRERLGTLSHASVLELFAGNGSLALSLARAGAHVTAVEAYAPAIELAERAAREQSLLLEAVAADAARFTQRQGARHFDAIIVNPPRRGLEVELRQALGRARPRVMAYVSCNPRTLARDGWHLARLGLKLTRAEPLDMIPWSDAVEALTWLSPSPPPSPAVVFEDESCVAVAKSPFENLCDAGRESLTARVRQLGGLEQAEPLERWGSAVSGVCWFARRRSDARAFAPLPSSREAMLTLLVRGNLRKQGTIAWAHGASERHGKNDTASIRYRKRDHVGRHSLVEAFTRDLDERGTLAAFAGIRHPVLGDAERGDPSSNHFVWHRHGLDHAFVHVTESSLDGRRARVDLDPDLKAVVRSLGSDEL